MNNSTQPATEAQQPAYRRIADGLRNEILCGRLAPRTRLPSTEELAVIWEASTFTVHSALVALVKEGWVERLHGAGTYVAEPANRFLTAGIYHAVDICSEDTSPFVRNLHGSLLKQFAQAKKKTHIFIDTRPPNKQQKLLPALAQAILERRIQCLVAPTVNGQSLHALTQLRLPIAFTNTLIPNSTDYDLISLAHESVRRLAAQGCRSVGLISPTQTGKASNDPATLFHNAFQQAILREGVVTRDEWNRCPDHYIHDRWLERFGYREFLELWNMKTKPDGLIVYPDTAGRGVLSAILQAGVETVSRRMKFVFHRNAHNTLLCPFVATWAISDEDTLAAGLLQLIKKQFNGEKVSPVLLAYTFKEEAQEWL